MRTDKIEVKIKIPVKFNEPDLNGNIYTKEAFENACKNSTAGLPIMFRDNDICNDGVVLGITTTKPSLEDNYVHFDGIIKYGGTECIVHDMDTDGDALKIKSFDINGFGISL